MNYPMNRRRILLLLALAVTVAGIVLFWPRGPKEPVYQGKKLSQWIDEAGTHPVLPVEGQDLLTSMQSARQSIRTLGTNALPWLMSEFTGASSKSRKGFTRRVSQNIRWALRLQDNNVRTRRAVRGIYVLGSNAAPALPALSTYLTVPGRRSDAAYAMAGAGELSLPYMLQAVASTNTDLAEVGAFGMMRLAHETESVIPHLVELLNHKVSTVRAFAMMGLDSAQSRPDLTLPAIVRAAVGADVSVRSIATNTLHELRFNTNAAVPVLRNLTTNSDPAIAAMASNALFRIDPSALPPRGP